MNYPDWKIEAALKSVLPDYTFDQEGLDGLIEEIMVELRNT